jgi:hypothetical protein
VGQIGILVADIVTASDQYQRIFGVTEWRRYTYGPGFVPDLWYRGQPGHTIIGAIEVPRRRLAPLVSWAQPHSHGGTPPGNGGNTPA